jgi:hypothetical protein
LILLLLLYLHISEIMLLSELFHGSDTAKLVCFFQCVTVTNFVFYSPPPPPLRHPAT